jgi:hypothetical protein
MPKIYVNTDNSNSKAKIYEAGKMGKSAAAAEQKMQDGKGYTIRIKVTKR